MRAGAHALSLLAVPLNVHVLQALAEGPRPLVDLRRAVGSPPQTTMRAHLRSLTEAGIVERRRQPEFPGSVDFGLGAAGRELLVVASVLSSWLEEGPEGALELGGIAAKSAVKALVDGWSTGIVRILAARPMPLTELSRVITDLSYPSLERRLSAMRLAGQIEPCPGAGRGTPYRVTEWLRHAVAPLAAAARWERANLAEETSPIRRLDVEAAFLLALPLLSLADELDGECRLAVEMRGREGETRLAGVIARLKAGKVTSCVARLEGSPDAWIGGPARDWLQAVIENDRRGLELGGDVELVSGILDGLHRELFVARQRA